MMNEPTLVKAQDHLEKLETVFEKWLQKKLDDREFAARAIIEILEAKGIIGKLISKSME